MPEYEFKCDTCGRIGLVVMTVAEYEKQREGIFHCVDPHVTDGPFPPCLGIMRRVFSATPFILRGKK